MAIDLLSIQPHKVSRDLGGYITYIYGEPKIGKTSLAVQIPDALLLACERGYNAIPGIRAIDITDWKTMRDVYKQLKQPEVQEVYKAVIVDTIDLAAKYCTKYICNKFGVSDLGEVGYGKAYAAMRSEFEDIFNSLTQMGYAVFFISHAAARTYTLNDGSTFDRIQPTLSPDKVNDIIKNMADIYAYAHWAKTEDGEMIRVLSILPQDNSVECGCRFGNIEPVIPLGYDPLVKALNDAIDEIERSGGSVTSDAIHSTSMPDYDYDALMAEFKELTQKLQQNVSKEDFKTKWAPFITATTEKYLGKGKKVTVDCSPAQVEQLALIVSDIEDEVGKGV